jgi:hypothetical protein
MKLALIVSFLIFASADVHAEEMRSFATDGCTMSPEGTFSKPKLWRECCVAHDLRFWGGGTKAERNFADAKLKACVRKKAGATVANIFFTGVRIGRLAPWKIPKMRWSNAWPGQPPYRPLTEEQIHTLLDLLPSTPIPSEMRETYRQELQARLPIP